MTTGSRREGLVKRFGRTTAVDGVSLAAPRGHVLGLLGPNGAGKTTVIRMLATLLRPDAGRALVAGIESDGIRPRSAGGSPCRASTRVSTRSCPGAPTWS